MKREINISVRNLVEYVMRSGDIDNQFRSMSRALEGTYAHQKVQKTYGKNDISEVTLKHELEYMEFQFKVEGRADGVLFRDNEVIIDEIKSTNRDLESIDVDFNSRHWAQAICYGYFYANQNSLDHLIVQLTYFHLETEKLKQFKRTMNFYELEGFFLNLLERYVKWASVTFDWIEKRDNSVENLDFPFKTYRKGQRELAVAAYKTIKEGKKLYAQAPTGIGKTISVIYPALKTMGEDQISKIFYLSAKTITREAPLYALEILKRKGLKCKAIVITAKEKICLNEEVKCNPEDCPYAKGHFDRVNDAIIDIFENEDRFIMEKVLEYSKKHTVCPFEFQLDVSLWADLIICDYNYVFNPRVYLKRFFDVNETNYAFLIDEAHNLVDRSREMFSANISKKKLMEVRKIVKSFSMKLYDEIYKVVRIINEKAKAGDSKNGYYQEEEIEELYFPIKRIISLIEAYLVEKKGSVGYEEVVDLYFELIGFIRISDLYDEDFVTTIEEIDKDIILTLYCVDASRNIRGALKRGSSAIFFSATLSPMDYFMNLLGKEAGDYHIRLNSPFPRENLNIRINATISTRYKDREKTYKAIKDNIYQFIKNKEGNYIVFFPSYYYMNRVYEIFKENHPNVHSIIQTGRMNESEKEDFLDEFNESEDLVAFAVLGGTFSEGIDLVGELLIGAVVVGVGMPLVGFWRNIIKDYFQSTLGEGFDYAYTYPGMNKVLQAAGRVIRTEEDKGSILLIDDRYKKNLYKNLMPPEWSIDWV
ncbi:MAG: ATP-dependent DNA helicase [Gudongella sp.]|nr:ATP-dependent DNA helicase [Gudongella sp.]